MGGNLPLEITKNTWKEEKRNRRGGADYKSRKWGETEAIIQMRKTKI